MIRAPRLSSKFIGRLVLVMLLIAPLIYVFGIVFCGLIGATDSPIAQGDYSLLDSLFDADNFVKRIGENVFSETPAGFAPFASFIVFIDTNMLHLSASGFGLFLYGYGYWCMHVLLLDVAFYLATFFIRFIKAIVVKFERGLE